MSSVAIPAYEFQEVAYIPLDFGGALIPTLGGPEQRLNRLGDRMAVRITTRPLANASEGMAMFQKLMRARKAGAITTLPQSGVAVGSPGSPVVSVAVSGGSTIAMSGFTSGYAIREGQPFSLIHAGRRYLHSADAAVAATGGAASLVVSPMLRTPISVGDVLEFALPMIEGALDGDPVAWERSAASVAPFTYTIREIQ